MCGICGIAHPSRTRLRVEEARLKVMRDALAHRGPDDAGLHVAASVGLGHRRLSIIDLKGGHQPMSNEDGSIWITFNGEIYNHLKLRPALERNGHIYRTTSDTETLLHLYEERGDRLVDELSGMFAFAVWDAPRRRLLLARDRLGIKPLYYHHRKDGSLYFASEIKSLLAAQAVSPEINHAALPDYLANHAPSGEETLFRGIRRLLPGHTLIWNDGRIEIRRYWDVSFRRESGGRARSEGELIEEWMSHFREAIRSHLMADVPLGLFLSGGIDSSAIAALMSGMVKEPIKTFSVAFAEPDANELDYARIVARAFGTDHHEVIVGSEQYFEALPHLVWHEDEPLGHPASVPLYFVSRLAARHVKVVLTGEGSDELLAGYYRYRTTLLNLALGAFYNRLTTARMRRGIRIGFEALPPRSRLRRRIERTFFCRRPDLESIYFDNFAVFQRAEQRSLLTRAAQERTGPIDPYAEALRLIESAGVETPLDRLLYADLKTYLHELLMKQDQMSMAASIESRVPFLDHALVEYSARLPERLKLRGWTTKYVLRRGFAGILPEPILKRGKMGFPVPLGRWFRERHRSVIEELLLSERAQARGLIEPAAVRRLVDEHQSLARDHSSRLWSLINLEIWQRQFIDGEAPEAKEAETAVEAAIGGKPE